MVNPLSYGQLSVWRFLETTPRTEWASSNLSRLLPLANGLSVRGVYQALTLLCLQYESLRTSYDFTDPLGPHQIVHADARPAVSVLEFADAEPQRLQLLADSLADRAFTLDDDRGWNAAIVVVGGHPRALIVTVNHIVTDGWSLRQVTRQLSRILASGYSVRYSDRELEARPRELARVQRSPGWAERRAASRSYWDQLLRSAPPPRSVPVKDERRVSGTLTLGRASGAVTAIARRERVFPQAVVLALMAVTIANVIGPHRFLLWLMVSNRFEPQWRNIVTSMNQTIPILVDINPSETFSALLGRLQRTSTTAVQHGCYDVDEVRQLAFDILGQPATIEYLVNYASKAWPNEVSPDQLVRLPAPIPVVAPSRRPAAAPLYAIVTGDAELSVAVHTHSYLRAGVFLDRFYEVLVSAARDHPAGDAMLARRVGDL